MNDVGTKRKNVSWRVSDQPESDLINDWLDQQKNIQDSLTNIILHTISRFGTRNITDYDIQKILYQESAVGNRAESINPSIQEQKEETKTAKESKNKMNDKVEENDPFNAVNIDDL